MHTFYWPGTWAPDEYATSVNHSSGRQPDAMHAGASMTTLTGYGIYRPVGVDNREPLTLVRLEGFEPPTSTFVALRSSPTELQAYILVTHLEPLAGLEPARPNAFIRTVTSTYRAIDTSSAAELQR